MGIGLGSSLIAAGALLAMLVQRAWRGKESSRAQDYAAAVKARGHEEAERARVRGEEQAVALREKAARALGEHEASERAMLLEYEALLASRETFLDGRFAKVDERAAALAREERAWAEREQHAQAAMTSALLLEDERVTALERACGETRLVAQAQRVQEIVSLAELEASMWLHSLEARKHEAAAREGRAIMRIVMERYDGQSHLDRLVSSVALAPKVFSAFVDPKGACQQALQEEVGCTLLLDQEHLVASVHGEDPLAREVARRVLRQLAAERGVSTETLTKLCRQVKTEVERDMHGAGRKALRVLGLERADPEVMHLLGRLMFRLSYSQNQWRHSIEVGHLAGLLAAELGFDVRLAKRAGLLHDIGKAMTHDHEGSHATLGALVAKRAGEEDVVVNAIASHHNDEPPASALAMIVAAADALSGGRPGARRESVTQYLNRIDDLQRIAGSSSAVKHVDIMQAGREVRVVVAGADSGDVDPLETHRGARLGDDDLQPLAKRIASAIEEEVVFAGQIKVTVIRESRAVSIAR